MIQQHQSRIVQMDYKEITTAAGAWKLRVLLMIFLPLLLGCSGGSKPFIAVIPRTTGVSLWEAVREGTLAAVGSHATIYWNAPTQQDDVNGQIALLQRETEKAHLEGIILAADNALALVTPIQQVLRKGVPVVVISSPLIVPAAGKLTYILNDEKEGGLLAAQRIGTLLNGSGTVAILGIDPGSIGVMERAGSLEANLGRLYPNVRIVDRRFGTYNLSHEQQTAAETLRDFPQLQALVTLTSTATRGAYFALADFHRTKSVKLIGFDQDIAFDSVKDGKIDSVVVQNTYEMGSLAVQEILAEEEHRSVPSVVRLKPVLVNRSNLDTPDVQHLLLFNWRLLH